MKNSLSFSFLVLFLPVSIFADDYSFDLDEIETISVKTYEYSGYLNAQSKYQNIKNKSNINSYYSEAMVDIKYFKDQYTLYSELMGNYENIDNSKNDTYTLNQLYLNYKQDKNHLINIGKISSQWGKGYFFNPIAFVNRRKDPYNPEAVKEGYELLGYKYNKVYNSNIIKNYTLDIIYIPTSDTQNNDFSNNNSNNIAFKSYFLFYDTDIDFAYLYSDKLPNKFGFDFSTNLQTNFEIHGEAVKSTNGLYSYLIGIKYLTTFDLTITSDYFFQNEILITTEPFWDNKYLITKLSQKEPLDILYLTTYYKNSLNIKDNSYQHSLGFLYNFINNINIDFSFGENKGNNTSEYGEKKVKNFINFEIKWSF